MTRIERIKRLQRRAGFDAVWHYCRDGKGKVERYKRFRAAQKWAQGNRKTAEKAREREKWNARRKAYRSRKRRILARINDQPRLGEGPNQGSTSLIEAAVVPTFVKHGIPVTSRKRWETFGNPSSDHYMGNTDADAADGGIANAQWLHKDIARAFSRVGAPLDAIPVDYAARYCQTPNGNRYRAQGIAQTHGTGPHYHLGVKRS